MAARKKIGLLFAYDDSWTGGIYYLFNIIQSLDRLPDNKKPHLVLFYNHPSMYEKLKALAYPYFEIRTFNKPLTSAQNFLRRLVKKVTRKAMKFSPDYSSGMVDFIFPCDNANYTETGSFKKIKKVYWIPDFQHKHLPAFFTSEGMAKRDEIFESIARQEATLVLSSEDAKNDFLKFYPNHKVRIKVMPFASVLPNCDHVNFQSLVERYSIAVPFFMCPNQFWAHKNHIVVLKAISHLRESGRQFQVFFTGKEVDHRNGGYIDELKKYVSDHGLQGYCKFLGFIDRCDQLQLMKNAVAIVQPSLFEGWSTVVEDAKAMNQTLVLSSLSVHKEQCGDRALYFNPHDHIGLADCIVKCLEEKIQFAPQDYENKIDTFAQQLVHLQ